MTQKQRPKCLRSGGFADNGRPLCQHGEAMYPNGDYWVCAVRVRARFRAKDREPERARARRHYEKHREQGRARQRDRYHNDPEWRARKLESAAQQIKVGRVYLGTIGFTQAEREAMLHGATVRP